MARVAVVTRTKDRPIMLPRALESVENQSFKDLLWVVVNDAGEKQHVDRLALIAREKGVEVNVVHRVQSSGMEAASNAGIRGSVSEFVVIHDDDDSWEPEFLTKIVAYLDQSPHLVGAITHSNRVVESVGAERVEILSRHPYNTHLGSVQIAEMILENLFAPISFVFRRSAYDLVGGFDESLPVLGDWDFNLKMLMIGEIGVLPMVLANYHIRMEVNGTQIQYGNSITTGVNRHVIQDAAYRNAKLRQDIRENRVGLGVLLCQARQIQTILSNLSTINRVLRGPTRLFKIVKEKFSF